MGEHKVTSSQNKLPVIVSVKAKQKQTSRQQKRGEKRKRKQNKKKAIDGYIALIPPKLKY